MRTKENAVTLIALVITIVLLLILASIGVTVGTSTIDSAKFTQFKSELKVMQDKVNELNQKNEQEIGQPLTNEQSAKLDIGVISNIIYKDIPSENIEKIKNGFRYISKDYINTELDLDSVDRGYLINVEYRYVIFPDGFKYEGTTYYMIDQIESEIYNVRYNDKNDKSGSFDINTTKENNKWKIEISNIQYNGYVDKWEVKYKLDGTSYWETSNDLTFYVKEAGKYDVKVVHSDEIDLGTQIAFAFDYNNGVNNPELLTGMTAIKFEEPTSDAEGTVITTTYTDEEWYDYNSKKWANVQTKDGSMWVWIPRYAYRINSKTQTCDIVFLIGTTDNYYDENGDIQTAKRQTTKDETIDTKTEYTVHPAFTDESSISYANGGWDKELSGIWVAKFEAGYASGNNSAEVKASSANYTQNSTLVYAKEAGTSSDSAQDARNWLDGIYGSTTTSIKYPTFQGLTYSMNYINHNDAYNISQVLTENGNIYGLSKTTTDSHLMKNSEWGAVAYLSQSKYGLNGINIYINNVTLNSGNQERTKTEGQSGVDSVYAVTGCSGITENASSVNTTIADINNRTVSNVYAWTQKNGTKASSTGTIYGIYDLSGGTNERTAALVANGNISLSTYGGLLLNNGVSTKYVTVYPSNDSGITDLDIAANNNYEKNTKIYGDAIRETSTSGTDSTSWYSDASYFAGYTNSFFRRGGRWMDTSSAGLFCFYRNDGSSLYNSGFRAVLVAR